MILQLMKKDISDLNTNLFNFFMHNLSDVNKIRKQENTIQNQHMIRKFLTENSPK